MNYNTEHLTALARQVSETFKTLVIIHNSAG
jgi:hypothetical protein